MPLNVEIKHSRIASQFYYDQFQLLDVAYNKYIRLSNKNYCLMMIHFVLRFCFVLNVVVILRLLET